MKALYVAGMLIAIGLFATYANAQWVPTNGPFGGEVTVLSLDPQSHIFAGTRYRGVFCSTDSGKHWTPSGLNRETVNAVAFDSIGSAFVGTYTGVFRSTDDGVTWFATSLKAVVLSLAVVPDGTVFAGLDRGLMRSTDGGASWERVLPETIGNFRYVFYSTTHGIIAGDVYRSSTGDSTSWVKLDCDHDGNINTLFESSWGDLYAGGSSAVYRSIDSGISWTRTQIVAGQDVVTIRELPNGILVAGGVPVDPAIPGGISISADSGKSWTTAALREWEIHSILLTDVNTILLGTGRGVFRATEVTGPWELFNEGLSATHVLGLAAVDSSVVLTATNVGIFKSTDDGDTWKDCSTGIFPRYIMSVTADKEGRLFLGTNVFPPDGGVFRSTDQGESWTNVSANYITKVYTGVKTLVVTDSDYVCAGMYHELYRSCDHGESWEGQAVDGDFREIAIDGEGRLFGATDGQGVLRSTDNGASWVSSSAGLAHPGALCVAVTDSDHVFVGGWQFLSRSTDHGDSWETKYTAPDRVKVESVTIGPNGDVLFSSSDGMVFRSTDEGSTWREETEGLVGNTITAFAVSANGTTFAGTNLCGVYKSVPSTAIGPAREPLFSYFKLYQNYPNPFNPSTRIKYTVAGTRNQGPGAGEAGAGVSGLGTSEAGAGNRGPGASNTRLVVYDLLGREVAVLVNERKLPGIMKSHSMATVSSGVYLYRLRADDYAETRKLCLIR